MESVQLPEGLGRDGSHVKSRWGVGLPCVLILH